MKHFSIHNRKCAYDCSNEWIVETRSDLHPRIVEEKCFSNEEAAKLFISEEQAYDSEIENAMHAQTNLP